jgi:branched-chain amino acid transport system substrate-binding protein
MKKKILQTVILTSALVMILATGLILPAKVLSQPKPIVIGCPVSMGVYYGPDCKNAQLLAIKEINAAGGVKVGGEKCPFKLVVADDRAMEPGVPVSESLLAIERLITQEKVDFLVGGPVRSEASFAARPLVTNYKKVHIITTGTYSPGFGDGEKYPYSFRITGHAGWEVPNVYMGLLRHIKGKFGFDKIYIMVQDVKHARATGDIVENLAGKEGFKIFGKQVYPTGCTDFSIGLLEAKNKGAQILFMVFDMPELTILAKQYFDFKVPALPVGYMGPAEHLEWWSMTEKKGEYFVVDLYNAGNVPSNTTPWTMKFVRAYEKEYGHEPDAYGLSTSYMAVYLLKDAIERAGTLNSDAVAKALEKTDMIGVYGRVRFDKNHEIIQSLDPKEGAVDTVFQWQNGKRITVFPEKVKAGDIKLPPWVK